MGYQQVKKFMRGQVWMVKEDPAITKAKLEGGDRTEAYSRPYVIITSQDDLNNCDGLIQCYPITSRIGIQTGTDIIFRNHKLEQNKIVTNQIQTRDEKNFMAYMFTMPDDIMADLDMIGAKRQGFYTTLININNEIKELQKELDKLKSEGLQIMDNTMSNYPYYTETQEPVEQIVTSEKTATKKTTKNKKVTNKVKHTYRKQRKWNQEMSKEFIDDYQNMNRQCMVDKYGLDKRQLAKTYYYLKNRDE